MLWASFYRFKNGISYTMNLAAFRVPEFGKRRDFFDRINKINMIFLFSLYPEHPVSEFRNSEAILSKKWDFLYYQATKEMK